MLMWILKVLTLIPIILIGIICYPFIPQTKDGEHFKLGWYDAIFGNEPDGINGDDAYLNKEAKQFPFKLFPTFWWCCRRNPCKNWQLRLGPNGHIQRIWGHGFWTYAIVEGKGYWSYRREISLGKKWYMNVWFGYRLAPYPALNSKFDVGEPFRNAIALKISLPRRRKDV